MRRDIRLPDLWRDDAPGERRAVCVEAGKIVEIHIQRDAYWVLGECGLGRVDRRTPAGAYIVTDGGSELLLRSKNGAAEGTRVAFEVTREAIAEPGRVKLPEVTPRDDMPDILLPKDRLWEQRLAAFGAPVVAQTFDDSFDVAIAGYSQVGDVIISFQRTKAGLVFDVDGVGDAFAINRVAAQEIARLLRLYQVGAMVMIDFVSMEAKTQRAEIASMFDAASAKDSRPFERTAINGYGLMQVVRARPRPSVLDHLFGTRIAALSDETQAYWLLRSAARSSGFGTRTITARAAVAHLLSSERWQPLRAECARLAGAGVEVVADENVTGYGHVHVAQS